jgi:hypothetical protein
MKIQSQYHHVQDLRWYFLQLKKFKEDFDLFDADLSDDINALEMQVRRLICFAFASLPPFKSTLVSVFHCHDSFAEHFQEARRKGSN